MKGPVVILGAILATMISTQAVAGSAAVASISSAPTGGRMYEAQALLHSMGFQPGHLDGYYGPRTAAAIKAFQKQEELPATGSLDEKTLERLEKILEWFRSDVSTLPLRDESATKPGPDDEMRENVIQLYSSAMVAGEDERLASVDLLDRAWAALELVMLTNSIPRVRMAAAARLGSARDLNSLSALAFALEYEKDPAVRVALQREIDAALPIEPDSTLATTSAPEGANEDALPVD